MEAVQDAAQSVQSKAEQPAMHAAKEIATKELAAAAGELYLFANLLNLTRGAAGIASEQYYTSAQPSVLFDTAVAIRDTAQQTNHSLLRAAKSSALTLIAGELGQLGISLQQRTHAHRQQIQSLQSLVSFGWQLLSESAANTHASAHHDFASAASRLLPANVLGESVHLLPVDTAVESTAPRRMVPRVPHVLCLPPVWTQYGPSLQRTGLIKPKMLAPLLLDTGSTSYRLALSASHSDICMRVQVCSHDGMGPHATRQTSEAVVTVDASALAPGSTSSSSLHSTCLRVCRSAVLDLLWDGLTVDALAMEQQLQDPAAGNVLCIHTGEVQRQAVGTKRQRSDSATGMRASLVRMSVSATSLTAEVHCHDQGQAYSSSRRHILTVSVAHAQESRGKTGQSSEAVASRCASLLASFATPEEGSGRVPLADALLRTGQGAGNSTESMLAQLLEGVCKYSMN